jgi:hypothetical protein
MMKTVKEDELEFINVTAEDDDDDVNNMTALSYSDPTQSDRASGMIGSWLFNQSKVSFR